MQVHLQSISYKEEIFILQCPDALFPVINLNHFRLKSKVSRYICVDFPHLVFAQDLAWSWATSKRVRLSVIQIKYNTSDRRTSMLNQIQTLHFIFPLRVQKWFQSVCAQISALVLTTSLVLVGEVSGLTEYSLGRWWWHVPVPGYPSPTTSKHHIPARVIQLCDTCLKVF